ncbi:Aste57867_11020 [Aphanomyces stellatus]|nr:hypothetical protein As57867_010979 [Aphanomyces stellatus]VFT87888.1 Aste57867_11020 [Aphanomyces stellatus]
MPQKMMDGGIGGHDLSAFTCDEVAFLLSTFASHDPSMDDTDEEEDGGLIHGRGIYVHVAAPLINLDDDLPSSTSDSEDLAHRPLLKAPSSTLAPRSPPHDDTTSYRCVHSDCTEAIKWPRGLCRNHGGVAKCIVRDCVRGPQTGGACINHGGGRRCKIGGCHRSVQTRGLCKTHGGGVRCGQDGCANSSQGGGFCRRHGGGKRCLAPGCAKGVQRHGYCAVHGQAKACLTVGCRRSNRGKRYCDAHRRQEKDDADDERGQ